MLLNIFVIPWLGIPVIAWLGIPAEHIPQTSREKQTDLVCVNASLCGHCKTGQLFLVRAVRHVVALGRKTVPPNMFSACFYDCFRLVKMYVDTGSRVLA